MNIFDHGRTAGDAATLSAAITGLLPGVVTVLTVIWMLLRILETRTVQCLLHRLTGGRLGERRATRAGGEG
ncbi:hypothetical protein [Azospirillum sp. B4]|uniref:hypothetical protein n=1 Tax=Azospirillum sp. B4 TaxID=95605 RepID=UPI0003475DDF|nr:hypothetical protein [Azospirillum sp. B4]